MSFKNIIMHSWGLFNRFCEWLKPIGDLFVRFWVAKFFFLTGLTQIENWSTTLMLFQFEYHLPFFSPFLAAVFAAFIQLGISLLLVLGLGGRLPALVLFLFNIIAVLSYPFLWTSAGHTGFRNHVFLGILLMILVLHGNGKLSLDYLINKRSIFNGSFAG